MDTVSLSETLVFPYHFTRHQTREEHRQHIENRQLETA
jgi:hypothetical protein